MPTVLPAKRRTWPDFVLMLVQRRWRRANIETTLGLNLCLLGSTRVFVYTQPSPSMIFLPADHGIFSKTAGQSQAYYNTWNWEWGTYDVIHLQILTCKVAVSTAGSVVNQFHGNIHSKTLGCRKIKSVFRDVKWCFNAARGLKWLIG